MTIQFYKYHGNGNDFVFIDNRNRNFATGNELPIVAKMCDRRFGIGADGLILIQNHEDADFEMVYYNADGNIGSMCGNGGRCAIHFAKYLKIKENEMVFNAYDGLHHGRVLKNGWISLEMRPTSLPQQINKDTFFIDTGSPHYVQFKEELATVEIVKEGRKIRYSPGYSKLGVNVNFVEIKHDSSLCVYTYERGVEDETLACGTGVTAAAISYLFRENSAAHSIEIETKGGPMRVRLTRHHNSFDHIWLEGPVSQVYEGSYLYN